MNTDQQRLLPLNSLFSKGSFVVHLYTLCATVDPTRSPGWIHEENGTWRRTIRTSQGIEGKNRKVYAVEAIGRSLMTHDQDDLATQMLIQYHYMNYDIDHGQTVILLQQMAANESFHVRASRSCDVRSDCQNPYHRLLVRPRVCARRQYSRFTNAVAANPSFLSAPDAHIRLGVSQETIALCKEQFYNEMAQEADAIDKPNN